MKKTKSVLIMANTSTNHDDYFKAFFPLIKTDFNIELFTSYFTKIADFLKNYDGEITFLTFHNYMKLPMFLSKIIFRSFQNNWDCSPIPQDLFVQQLTELYAGPLNSKIKMIFNMLDYDRGNSICIDDVNLVITHFHSFLNLSERNINNNSVIISNFFNNTPIMSFEQFKTKLMNENADLFYLMYYYLFTFKPYNDQTLEYYSERIIHQNKENPSINQDLLTLHQPSVELYEYLKIVQNCEFKELKEFENSVSFFTKTFSKTNTIKYHSQKDMDYSFIEKVSKEESRKSQIFQTICLSNNNGCFKNIFKMTFLDGVESKNSKDLGSMLSFEQDYFSSKCRDENNEKCKIEIIGNDIFIFNTDRKSHINHPILRKIIPIKDLAIENEKDEDYQVNIISTLCNKYDIYTYKFKTKELKDKFTYLINAKTNFVRLESEYFIDSIVGKGCFGTVVKGQNIETHEQVAIKIIKKDFENMESIRCARNEQDILKFIMMNPHKHIIKIKSVIESLRAIYIIQEYIPKGNLENYIYTHIGRWNSDEKIKIAVEIMKQLANAMNHYMSYGIVHRDLKPQNILIQINTNKIDIKIIDFGFSTIIFKKELLIQRYGTLLYLAPEIIMNHFYNNKVDIWSFSLISYFVLYGKHFFMYHSLENIKEKIENVEEHLPLISDNPGCKYVKLHTIMSQCLSRRLKERPDIVEVINLLRDI